MKTKLMVTYTTIVVLTAIGMIVATVLAGVNIHDLVQMESATRTLSAFAGENLDGSWMVKPTLTIVGCACSIACGALTVLHFTGKLRLIGSSESVERI